MKLSKIAIATASVCGVLSSPAFAIPATAFDATVVNVRVSGATALDPGLLEAVLKICQLGTLNRYGASNQAVFFCLADGTKITLANGTKLAVYKHSVGGSGNGVQPIADGSALPFLDLGNAGFAALYTATTVVTSAGGFSYNDSTITSAGLTANTVAKIGISDLEPAFFGNVTVGNLATLASEALGTVIFGVPVTRNVYEALQLAQSKVVGSLIETNMPTLNTPQLTTLYTQAGQQWNAATRGQITIPVDDTIYVARRADTSGTQKTFEALFARSPNGLLGKSINNGSDGLTPDTFSSGSDAGNNTVANTLINQGDLTINNSGSSQVVFSLNRFQALGKGAVGTLSADSIISTTGPANSTTPSDNIRYVKLNNVAPTIANVINGSYSYYGDAALNTKNLDTGLPVPGGTSTIERLFYTALKQQFALFPAVQPWGNTGTVTLNEVTGGTTGNPWSRQKAGVLNNGQQARLF